MRPILYAGVIFSFFIALGVLSGYVAHPFRTAQAEPVVRQAKAGAVFEDVSVITLPTGELRKFYDNGADVWAVRSADGGQTWGEPELVVAGAVAPEVVMVGDRFMLRATAGESLATFTSTDGITFTMSSE